jgi:hypothetical protein
MNPIYQKALDGTLKSDAIGAALSGVQVYNKLCCPVLCYFVDAIGLRSRIGLIYPGENAALTGAKVGDYYVATVPASGAFICVFMMKSGVTSYYIDNAMLVDPNDIGALPAPNSTVLVPPNSPRVLVACAYVAQPLPQPPGKTPAPAKQLNYITREQYWALQGDSYSVAPGETRTVSYTVTAGKQETSSDEKTVATSLGASAGASGGITGWGSVSTTISASLNASASVFQQVTVTEQTSTYVSDSVSNKTTDTNLVLRWQIADIVTVFNPSSVAQSTISSASVVIAQATPLSKLKPATARPELVPREPAPALGPSTPAPG